ncbi:MAG: hypothetical protein HUJ91_06970, partial [Bacteroidales bacterium]|nr:hypothetical protein [Bacteroidales bacterium]
MKKDVVIMAAVAALATGCQSRSVAECDFSKPFPLEADLSRSLQSRIDSEPVSDSLLVCDMETIGGWSTYGITTADITAERSVDGGHSLRFCTPMRDTAFIKAHRTGWNSFA